MKVALSTHSCPHLRIPTRDCFMRAANSPIVLNGNRKRELLGVQRGKMDKRDTRGQIPLSNAWHGDMLANNIVCKGGLRTIEAQ